MLNYISALSHGDKVRKLEARMQDYYRFNANYYKDISFSGSNWSVPRNPLYDDILVNARGKSVCEIGCGRAEILSTGELDEQAYSGCDFSKELVARNARQYPNATFKEISEASSFPFLDGSFDLVFSIFVLEHVVRPQLFLAEVSRIAKYKSRAIILCPDFARQRGISSQRTGKTFGSGMQKLRDGRFADALVSLLVNKFLLPIYLGWKLRCASRNPVFLLNADPSCFYYDFHPDVDAVYVCHSGEIICEMRKYGFRQRRLSSELEHAARVHGLIYLVFER